VIDTGIDPFHFDMLGLIDGASSAAFTPSQNLAGPAWGDDHFHGTHVAGSIVTNGFGTSGVAPHTTLIAIKVVDRFENGTFADVIAGILHAVAVDADVINMSLGEPVVRHLPGGGRLTALLNQAMGYAAAHGVLVVSAAGNQATDLTYIRDVAAMPCESGSGICVSATGPTDAPASYSNFGRAVDLSGPGGDLAITGVPSTSMIVAPCSTLSLVPALIAAGCPGNFRYLFLEGTSMATAHVSGAAALVDAQHGGSLNGGQLKSILQVSADDLGMPGADTSFGRGRLNVLDAVER
jgi:subtilisin